MKLSTSNPITNKARGPRLGGGATGHFLKTQRVWL